jgi:hypothetical protein
MSAPAPSSRVGVSRASSWVVWQRISVVVPKLGPVTVFCGNYHRLRPLLASDNSSPVNLSRYTRRASFE